LEPVNFTDDELAGGEKEEGRTDGGVSLTNEE